MIKTNVHVPKYQNYSMITSASSLETLLPIMFIISTIYQLNRIIVSYFISQFGYFNMYINYLFLQLPQLIGYKIYLVFNLALSDLLNHISLSFLLPADTISFSIRTIKPKHLKLHYHIRIAQLHNQSITKAINHEINSYCNRATAKSVKSITKK